MRDYNLSKNIDVYEVQSLLLLESLFKYDAVIQNIEEKPKVRVILLVWFSHFLCSEKGVGNGFDYFLYSCGNPRVG